MKILIIGTGCCGFLRLYDILKKSNMSVFYKSLVKYQNSIQDCSPFFWSFFQHFDYNSEKLVKNIINTYDVYIGHYFLPYISLFIKVYPNINVLVLNGGQFSITELANRWGYCNPLTLTYRNVNTRVNLNHYPNYLEFTNIEATNYFCKDYYKICDELYQKYPNNIQIINTDEIQELKINNDKYSWALPNKNENYTTSLNGGFGNMLFQMSETIAWCSEYKLPEPVFSIYNDKENILPSAYKFDICLNGHKGSWDDMCSSFSNVKWGEENLQATSDTRFTINDMFSFNRVHHMRKEILKRFSPNKNIIKYIEDKYPFYAYNKENLVSLHYRTWTLDVDNLTSRHVQISQQWYKEVFDKYFNNDTIYLMFSDNIEKCKQDFKDNSNKYKLVFIDENQFISIFMMSMCNDHIIHASTYSFWGAYLNVQQPECITILHPVFYDVHNNSNNMIPYKEWIIHI